MPAFPHLSDAEIDAVAAHVSALATGKPPEAGPVATLTDEELGSRIYASNCATCHQAGGARQWGMMCQPASLAGATKRFSKAQVMNLLDSGAGPMPAFKHLNTAERDALWHHLGTLPADSGSTSMGAMCPMVRAAMQGKPMGLPHGRDHMGPGMMRGHEMGAGMGCPMMMGGPGPGDAGAEPRGRAPACCR